MGGMRALRIAAVLLLCSVSGPGPAHADETLRYRWKLSGFAGALASLFVPGGGEGVLSFVPLADQRIVRGELLVTSKESDKGDYFRYGSEWTAPDGPTLRAWSDLVWRGEAKSKRSDVEQPGVIDIVSGIHILRHNPPAAPRRMEIWSDGRLYPVLVLPRGVEKRRLEGREVQARHLEVLGLKVADRKQWKGDLHLWIADDEQATPVEIQVERKGVRVRLEFVDRGTDAPPAGPPAPPESPEGGV